MLKRIETQYEIRIQALEAQLAENVVSEEALRNRTVQLMNVLDQSPFAFSVVSRSERKRLYFNRRFVELFAGTAEGDLMTADIGDSYVDPGKRDRNWEQFERDGRIENSEEQRRRLDGTEWWCLSGWNPFTFGGEDAVLIWNFDITERKHTADQLEQSNDLLELLLKVATLANEATDFQSALKTCLAALAEFTNWQIGHVFVLSDDDKDLLVPTDIWCLREPGRYGRFVEASATATYRRGFGILGQALVEGRPVWQVDLLGSANTARGVLAAELGLRSSVAIPVVVGQEVVAVLQYLAEDVIEPSERLIRALTHLGSQLGQVFQRKRTEQHLRRAMAEIDEANRALERRVRERTAELHVALETAEQAGEEARLANRSKTEFLANMSHEVRTPLNAIIGFSQMIKEEMFGPLSESYRGYGSDIHCAGEHLLKLLSDILDVSRVEIGGLEFNPEDIDPQELFLECGKLVSGRMHEARVKFEMDIPPLPARLFGDKVRIKQVLLNVLTNAAKFTPAGGRVAAQCRLAGNGGILIVVSDTGIGIAKADLPLVVEKFGQVRDGATKSHEGVGLGLALSKSLMERHGGTLSIDSRLGAGTTVTAYFPPKAESPLSATSAPEPACSPAGAV